MEREFRVSAGAIIIKEGKILLVRYIDGKNNNYLVGPGGGVLIDEGVNKAVIREVKEETGLKVSPGKVLFVEDILYKRYRITKIWFLCNPVGGRLTKTIGAIQEGITEVKWYRRDQLNNEVVYPTPLLKYNWDDFFKDNWQSLYIELQNAGF
jgi:8-oxo-dGTP diphosphatase